MFIIEGKQKERGKKERKERRGEGNKGKGRDGKRKGSIKGEMGRNEGEEEME